MKIAILILYTESWQPLADIVLQNLHKYADANKERYGYDEIIIKYKNEFSGFEKIKKIQKHIGRYDAIWSLDLDALITNHKTNIEDFINDENDFYICEDYNGINAGSFIVKDSQWSQAFLNSALMRKGDSGVYCEQDAFSKLLSSDVPVYNEKVKILPHPSINSYLYESYPECGIQTHETGQWQEGDFVLHLPGIGMDKRIEIFKNTKITL